MRIRGEVIPWARVALSLVLSLTLLVPMTAAQDAPPDLAGTVIDDPLTAPGLVRASRCPTGKNSREFVGEGYLLKVTGKCTDSATTAGVSSFIEGLTFPDGEVRLELRAVSGVERAL